jgi:hypothetical protein
MAEVQNSKHHLDLRALVRVGHEHALFGPQELVQEMCNRLEPAWNF